MWGGGIVLTSCHKEFDESLEEESQVVEYPTTDQLTEQTSLPAYFSPFVKGSTAQYLKNRLTNLQSNLSPNTKVAVLSEVELSTLSDETFDTLCEILHNGGSILIHQPDYGVLRGFKEELGMTIMDKLDFGLFDDEDEYDINDEWLEFAQDLVNIEDEGEANNLEMVGEWVGINFRTGYYYMHELDFDDKTVTLSMIEEADSDVGIDPTVEPIPETIISSGPPTDLSFSDYEYGTLADGVVNWLNITPEQVQMRMNAFNAKLATRAGANAPSKLPNVVGRTYPVTASITIKTQYHSNNTKENTRNSMRFRNPGNFTRVTSVSLSALYTCVHSYDEGCDYYIFEQLWTAHNGSLGCAVAKDAWNDMEHHSIGSLTTHYWLGPYMTLLMLNHNFSVGNKGNEGVHVLSKHSVPFNPNEEKFLDNPFLFDLDNINLSIGAGGIGAKKQKGLNISINKTPHKVEKISFIKNPLNDRSERWTYYGDHQTAEVIKGHTMHNIVPEMQRGDASFDQCYVVRVNNPNREQVRLHVGIAYQTEVMLVNFIAVGSCKKDHFQSTWKEESHQGELLEIPARFPETWIRTINVEGKDYSQSDKVAKVEKFEKVFQEQMNAYKDNKLEILSTYSPKELKDPKIWKKSIIGQYLNDFEKSLRTRVKLIDAKLGIDPGTYIISYSFLEEEITKSYRVVIKEGGDGKNNQVIAE